MTDVNVISNYAHRNVFNVRYSVAVVQSRLPAEQVDELTKGMRVSPGILRMHMPPTKRNTSIKSKLTEKPVGVVQYSTA